jgi:hypothetical protein
MKAGFNLMNNRYGAPINKSHDNFLSILVNFVDIFGIRCVRLNISRSHIRCTPRMRLFVSVRLQEIRNFTKRKNCIVITCFHCNDKLKENYKKTSLSLEAGLAGETPYASGIAI